jgi:hypothetical protein
MVSKNNNKALLATLALMLLSFSVASSTAISAPQYAMAQGVTVEGGGNATNATMTGAAGNATNATMTGAAGNATNATMTGAAGNATNATTGDDGTAAGTQIGGPLSLYGGGGGQ